jgi:threonine/homoserine/homoserine lactone efflux protein
MVARRSCASLRPDPRRVPGKNQPMTWKILALYLATIVPLVCTPGPDILFVSSQALAARRRGALLATAGICAGYLVHAMLATLGLAALIAASPLLFQAVKWLGAAYLLYVGVSLIRAAISGSSGQRPKPDGRAAILLRGMLTSLLNPKGLLFFLALLPQFVDPVSGQAAFQTFVLALVFVMACFVVYLGVGLVVAAARGRFAGNTAERAAHGVAGAVCAAIGLRLALIR